MQDHSPPAFPQVPTVGPSDDVYRSWDAQGSEGMSLRDYFAGQALVGIGTWVPGYSDFNHLLSDAQKRAAYAYRVADSMLEARRDTEKTE